MQHMPSGSRGRVAEYEYRVVTIGRGVSRADMRQRLTADAEYGQWELARTRIYLGGWRKVWLRRRVMRVEGTL